MDEIPDEYYYYQMNGGKLSYKGWREIQQLPHPGEIMVYTFITAVLGILISAPIYLLLHFLLN